MGDFDVELENLERVGEKYLPKASDTFGAAKDEIYGAYNIYGTPVSGELYEEVGSALNTVQSQFFKIFGEVDAELELAGEAILEIANRYREADGGNQ